CFSRRRRHTRSKRGWSSDVCSSDLNHLNRWLYFSHNFYAPLYEYIPNPKGTIMFKNPWTGLIVYAIVKISAFMLIRIWLQKAIDELLESNQSLKDMYPDQF